MTIDTSNIYRGRRRDAVRRIERAIKIQRNNRRRHRMRLNATWQSIKENTGVFLEADRSTVLCNLRSLLLVEHRQIELSTQNKISALEQLRTRIIGGDSR